MIEWCGYCADRPSECSVELELADGTEAIALLCHDCLDRLTEEVQALAESRPVRHGQITVSRRESHKT